VREEEVTPNNHKDSDMEVSKVQENIEKGLPPNAGVGRPKGTPNKSTAIVRDAIAKMADENADKFNEWLTAVAATSPEKACDIYLKAIEYHIPKLARTEVTGDANQPIHHVFGWMK
jgi:hypothetical protein